MQESLTGFGHNPQDSDCGKSGDDQMAVHHGSFKCAFSVVRGVVSGRCPT